MIKFKQYFYEKTVVGLIETIFINGIGEVEAKIDSGNGAYNVLHGTNIEVDNEREICSFLTINNKKIEKPIVEHITINIGAGNFEDRPVVLFDIKIGEQNFDNVKFSIGNRSNNEYGVLIGKDFIRNDLDALIDVDGRNMFAKHIDVDYE
jgi:hypothetical protein